MRYLIIHYNKTVKYLVIVNIKLNLNGSDSF